MSHDLCIQSCSQQSGHAPVYTDDAKEGSGLQQPKAAQLEVFNAYVNGALQRALSERLARWGTELDRKSVV